MNNTILYDIDIGDEISLKKFISLKDLSQLENVPTNEFIMINLKIIKLQMIIILILNSMEKLMII